MLKMIGVEHLNTGIRIQELCGSWTEHPFRRTKFVIMDPNDIRLIIDSGIKEVWVDVERGIDVPAAESKETVEAKVDEALMHAAIKGTPQQVAQPRVAMAEEVKRAASICATSKSAVVSMFGEAHAGRWRHGERRAAGRMPAPSRKNRRQRLPASTEGREHQHVCKDGRGMRRLWRDHLQPALKGGMGSGRIHPQDNRAVQRTLSFPRNS